MKSNNSNRRRALIKHHSALQKSRSITSVLKATKREIEATRQEIIKAAEQPGILYEKKTELYGELEERFVDNKRYENPSADQKTEWMRAFTAVAAVIVVDFFLIQGAVSFLLSGLSLWWPLSLIITLLLVSVLVFIEVTFGKDMPDHPVTRMWPAGIALMSVATFLATGMLELADFDWLMLVQAFFIGIISWGSHSIPIKKADEIMDCYTWISHNRLLEQYNAYHEALKPACAELFILYKKWIRLHEENDLEVNMDDIPKHIQTLIAYFQDDDFEDLDSLPVLTGDDEPPIAGGDGAAAVTEYEVIQE